jgi:response regulator RpfG family c-di-GMP phosphodiesterase
VAELAAAGPAVRHHHERFDGDGYPDGLAGEAIPVEARVVAVADVCALQLPHERPDPRARKAAAHRLRQLAGNALDPALVGAAITVLAAEAERAGEYLPRSA